MTDRLKLTVLISGTGTTLRNLIDVRRRDSLNAEIVQVISSNPAATGNRIAHQNNLPLAVLPAAEFGDPLSCSAAIFEQCRLAGTDLVVLAGFLKRLTIPADFENRVVNIHPSLIPAFSGKGYYGLRVHSAVLDFGCKVSGCTVHFVDNEYDHGPIIAQRPVEVCRNDTPRTLQQRVFSIECELYPAVINLIAENRLTIKERTVSIAPQ